MTSVKTELAALSSELGIPQAKTTGRPERDPGLLAKCQSVEKERYELRTLLREAEKQLTTAQRDMIALSIKSSPTREGERFMLKSEHAALLKRREE